MLQISLNLHTGEAGQCLVNEATRIGDLALLIARYEALVLLIAHYEVPRTQVTTVRSFVEKAYMYFRCTSSKIQNRA